MGPLLVLKKQTFGFLIKNMKKCPQKFGTVEQVPYLCGMNHKVLPDWRIKKLREILEKYALTEEQRDVLASAQLERVSFITGKPGTGKSHLVKCWVEMLSCMQLNYVVLAPTGIAAANIGGQSIHSFYKIKIGDEYTKNDYVDDKLGAMLRTLDFIIIDEASMVRPDLLDLVLDKMIRAGANLDKVAWMFVGDMAQLKAFSKQGEPYDFEKYKGYDFRASTLGSKAKEFCLTEVKRQKDAEFLKNLDDLRNGEITGYWDNFVGDFDNDGIYLCHTRMEAARINDQRLRSNPNKLFPIETNYSDVKHANDFPLPAVLNLKTGLQMVHLLNSDGLVNGSRGTLEVKETPQGIEVFLVVKGEWYRINKKEFECYEYYMSGGKIQKRVKATASNYPLGQCDAMTIHKAQGSQFDKIFVNARSIPNDLTYVAVSRVTSPEGLTISF